MGGGGGCCVGDFCCIGNCCVKNCCVLDIGGFCIDLLPRGGGHSSGSDDIGSSGSYNPDVAGLEETVRIQEALTKFKSDTQSRSEKLETKIVETARQHLDEFIDELEKYNKYKYGSMSLSINLKHLQKENRKTEDKIHGFITKRVSERISYGDSECQEILRMDAGEAKTNAMDAFYKKVLTEAVNELSDELRDSMETQTDNVQNTIQDRIDSIVDVCEAKAEEFERIREMKETDEAEIEQEQLRMAHFIALCEYGLDQL